MDADKHALLRVHAGCCNGHDVASLVGHYPATCRCITDGHLVGEGPDSARRALEDDLARLGPEHFGRVMMDVGGEPMLVQWSDVEGQREPRAIVRLESRFGRVSELRIDHDEAVIRRLLDRARPA